MVKYSKGDRVRVDIPDETDPEFPKYHGEHGTVVKVNKDDLGGLTGDDRDAYIYEVELDDGETVDFRWRDLRPLQNEQQ